MVRVELVELAVELVVELVVLSVVLDTVVEIALTVKSLIVLWLEVVEPLKVIELDWVDVLDRVDVLDWLVVGGFVVVVKLAAIIAAENASHFLKFSTPLTHCLTSVIKNIKYIGVLAKKNANCKCSKWCVA
jgi:hypothetical protein